MDIKYHFTNGQKHFLLQKFNTIDKIIHSKIPSSTGFSLEEIKGIINHLKIVIGLGNEEKKSKQKWYKIKDRKPPLGTVVIVQFNVNNEIFLPHFSLCELHIKGTEFRWINAFYNTLIQDEQLWTFIPEIEQ